MTSDPLAVASGLASWTLEDERYQVRSRLEIVSILRGLVGKSEFATVYFGAGRDFIVTMMLALDAQAEHVVFDFGADGAANDRMLRADRLLVVSQLSHVRVQFAADRAQVTTFDGGPAFRVRVPSMLTRLQRREFYRVRVPGTRPVRCDVPVSEDAGSVRVPLRVLDLSSGGLALTDLPSHLKVETGTAWHGCRLALPDLGPLSVDLGVVRVIESPASRGTVARRVGAQFLKLPDGTRAQVQRYINRLEREQLAK